MDRVNPSQGYRVTTRMHFTFRGHSLKVSYWLNLLDTCVKYCKRYSRCGCLWVNIFPSLFSKCTFNGGIFWHLESFSTNWGNDCPVSFHSAGSKALNSLIVQVCFNENTRIWAEKNWIWSLHLCKLPYGNLFLFQVCLHERTLFCIQNNFVIWAPCYITYGKIASIEKIWTLFNCTFWCLTDHMTIWGKIVNDNGGLSVDLISIMWSFGHQCIF